MNQIKNKRDTNIRFLRNFIIGSLFTVLLFTGISVYAIRQLDKQEADRAAESDIEYDVETGVYENVINADSFLNRAPLAYPEDTRKVFRIIEVIPHEICSIFPYFIEWGSEEEYNKNVPIGYEGLLKCVTYGSGEIGMFSEPNTIASSGRPYVKKINYFKRDYLTYYQGNVGSDGWDRKTDTSAGGIITASGYFEYVGNGLGLYHLNTDILANQTSGQKGINNEIQAMNRKGSETAKGDFYVEAPAYYWSKAHGATGTLSFPDYNDGSGPKTVISSTGYHYNLEFEVSQTEGAYTPDKINKKIDQSSSIGNNNNFDYFLTADSPDTWVNGFEYYKNGNYTVESVSQNNIDGQYVRISDANNFDGFYDAVLNLDPGYFVLATGSYASAGKKYDVKFQESAGGKGSYVAMPHAASEWMIKTDYSFVYSSGTGNYDVSFIYDAGTAYNGKKYKGTLTEVAYNEGQYALTSTKKDANNNPNYLAKDNSGYPCDYSQIITNIDFIDGTTASSSPGVVDGGTSGSWVFREVSDASKMELTNLNTVYRKNGFSSGFKIYVTNQTRRHRYYVKNGFVNNEWFKLLCYSSHPDDAAANEPYTTDVLGDGADALTYYNFNKTSEDNLNSANSQKLIKIFDGEYRIEILQRTPDKLTEEEVKSADLIYLSNIVGIQSLNNKWGEISSYRQSLGLSGLTGLPNTWSTQFAFSADFSDSVMYTIYDECVYKRNCAIMISSSVFATSYEIRSNVLKLCFMLNFFENDKKFAEFMTWYPDERNDIYSRLLSDGTVQPYSQSGAEWTYNKIEPPEDITPVDNWDYRYFQIQDEYGNKFGPGGRWLVNNTANVKDGSTKYILDQYVGNLFHSTERTMNIWKILNHREGKDEGIIVVNITNADILRNNDKTQVIYADEFDPDSFKIDYEIIPMYYSNIPPPLASIEIAFADGAAPVSLPGPAALDYNQPYTIDSRSGFSQGNSTDQSSALDPGITMRKVTITAKANDGTTGTADVWVIVREAFDLN